MACVTLQGHVSRAVDFYNKGDIYFGIGRTTEWVDEKNPPTPGIESVVEELVGFKRVESKYFVVPDENGEITYKDSRWAIVPAEEAVSRGARWVYLNCFIAFSELPTDISYRQIGVYSGMKISEGYESVYALYPENVVDTGVLEIIDNRKPIYRSADLREQLSIIIEF